MAKSGPLARAASKSLVIASFSVWGSFSILWYKLANPSLGLIPMVSKVSTYFTKTGFNKVSTTWPKIIGSETFIIVAFRWTEKRTPFSFASSISFFKNSINASLFNTVASIISPACKSILSLSIVSEDSDTNLIWIEVA